jgi:hypothetical protein
MVMDLNLSDSFGEICSVASDMFVSSFSDALWTGIRYLWPWYWLFIILALIAWVSWEIRTRYTTVSFRSQNGFTPTFNRFVGSGTYLGTQTLIFLILTSLLGTYVYCLKWPAALHLLTFLFSGWFLNYIGFWVYLKEPGKRRKKYRKKHY